MRLHELRLHIPHYEEIIDGEKTYDIRHTRDRDFQVGDLIRFEEWRPTPNLSWGTVGYTGRSFLAVIVHITPPGKWGLPNHLAVLGLATIEPISPEKRPVPVAATIDERDIVVGPTR